MFGELGASLQIVLLGLLAGGTRALISAEPPSIRVLLGTILASVFLAVTLHPLLSDRSYGSGVVTFLVAIGSFSAVDALPILPKLFKQLSKDPLSLVREFLVFRFGNKPKDKGDD